VVNLTAAVKELTTMLRKAGPGPARSRDRAHPSGAYPRLGASST
jgi:hypothetical protein